MTNETAYEENIYNTDSDETTDPVKMQYLKRRRF